jgi:hypothetical protein
MTLSSSEKRMMAARGGGGKEAPELHPLRRNAASISGRLTFPLSVRGNSRIGMILNTPM